MSKGEERRLLAALLFGNFVTGTGILLPAGMLTELARGLDVSVPAAGSLILASGLVVALGAPVAAALTASVDRRKLLAASMAGYVFCHLASAAAPTFAVLLLLRAILAVPAAIFTPQAAAAIGAMLPPERRAPAITTIFIGWSLASVAGVPLGGYVGHALGWRTALLIVAGLSVIATAAVLATVPKNVTTPPLKAEAWRRVLTSKALMTVLLVTLANGTGQFTLFTYLTPYLQTYLTNDPGISTLILAWYGVAATIGNVLTTRLVSRIGTPRSAMTTLLIMATGMILWALLSGTLDGALLATLVWGFGTFATMSIQQARLAGIAPSLTSASIALNSSAIYLGQAAGSGIGGALIRADHLGFIPYAGAAILIGAAAISVIAERWEPGREVLDPRLKAENANP